MAVCWPELLVYIDEKPGVTPMFDDDHAEFVRGNFFADDVFDLRDQFLGDFDAGAGGRLDVDDELAGIGSREIGDADERETGRG